MDDMVLWHNNKDILLDTGHKFEQYIQTQLNLSLKPFCLNNTLKGLPFLGFVLSPFGIRLNKRSKKRFITKYKNYENKLKAGIWTQKEYQTHITPLFGFVEKADTIAFRKKILHSNDN